jgi:hypothetical protein
MANTRDRMEIKLLFFDRGVAVGRYAITALVLTLLVRSLAVAARAIKRPSP